MFYCIMNYYLSRPPWLLLRLICGPLLVCLQGALHCEITCSCFKIRHIFKCNQKIVADNCKRLILKSLLWSHEDQVEVESVLVKKVSSPPVCNPNLTRVSHHCKTKSTKSTFIVANALWKATFMVASRSPLRLRLDLLKCPQSSFMHDRPPPIGTRKNVRSLTTFLVSCWKNKVCLKKKESETTQKQQVID